MNEKERAAMQQALEFLEAGSFVYPTQLADNLRAARRVLELVDGYNLHRVAWELERTALNDGFYGNALRAAKDIAGVTDEERALLDRYATGGIQSMDHCALQRLAMKIDEMADRQRDAADKAEVAEPEPIQAVAFEPSSEQLHGLWDGLSRCLTKTSTINFLRVWIRDWTAHKVDALAQEQPEPAQEPVAWNWMLDGRPYGQAYYGNPPDADIAERAAISGRTVRLLYAKPFGSKPLTDEEIDTATAQERDSLLDHIYEYGTAAEGVLERIRKLCRAAIRMVEE